MTMTARARRVTAALTTITLALAGAGSARADVYDDNPAAASRGPGDAYLFARGADGAVLERHRSGTGWTDWVSLGGNATSGPAAAAYGNTINVFVRGTDGAIYQDALADGKWSGWTSLGGNATSAPAAVSRRGPENAFDIAVRGTDNAIWVRSYTPTSGWLGWGSIGGNLTSAPTLNSQGDGILNVMARGTDGSVVQRSWDGSQWFPDWISLGGGTIGAPASVSRQPEYLNLYVRSPGQAIWGRSWMSGWSDYTPLDNTPMDSSVAAYSEGSDHEAIVARKGANLWLKTWTGSTGWGGWTDLGPIAVPVAPSPPPATPAPADGELDLQTGVRCTPAAGRLRVHIEVHTPRGKKQPRVTSIVFFTRGKGRSVRVDHKAPFVVHLKINRPAGSTGRVYARVAYRRGAKGKLHRKLVSRRYTVCR